MNIGLPGTGVGGLFYLLMALLMPLNEAMRTLQGRGCRTRWRTALRQSAIALGVISSMALTNWVIQHLLPRHSGSAFHSVSGEVSRAIGLTPTFWSFGTLAVLMIAVQCGRLFIGRYPGSAEIS